METRENFDDYIKDGSVTVDSRLTVIKTDGRALLEERETIECWEEDGGVSRTINWERVAMAGCGHAVMEGKIAGRCNVCQRSACLREGCLITCRVCSYPVCRAHRIEYDDEQVFCRHHAGARVVRVLKNIFLG